MNTYSLIIYDLNPDEVKTYLIPDSVIDSKEGFRKALDGFDGRYINGSLFEGEADEEILSVFSKYMNGEAWNSGDFNDEYKNECKIENDLINQYVIDNPEYEANCMISKIYKVGFYL